MVAREFLPAGKRAHYSLDRGNETNEVTEPEQCVSGLSNIVSFYHPRINGVGIKEIKPKELELMESSRRRGERSVGVTHH